MPSANAREIRIDADIYDFLLSNVQAIGEDASSILRRLLAIPNGRGGQKPPTASEARATSREGGEAPGTSDLLAFVSGPEFGSLRNVTEKFLAILGFLHRHHEHDFEKLLGLGGRKRTYFGRSRSDIARSGNRTYPRQIPGSEYWVLTNAANHHKRDILRRALQTLGYSPHEQSATVSRLA